MRFPSSPASCNLLGSQPATSLLFDEISPSVQAAIRHSGDSRASKATLHNIHAMVMTIASAGSMEVGIVAGCVAHLTFMLEVEI